MSIARPNNKHDIRLKVGKDYYDLSEFTDNYFDLIYVDGEYRKKSFMSSLSKLKSGGYIFIDNVPDQIQFDDEMINEVKDWTGYEASGGGHPSTYWFQKP